LLAKGLGIDIDLFERGFRAPATSALRRLGLKGKYAACVAERGLVGGPQGLPTVSVARSAMRTHNGVLLRNQLL
jgi:hypothetical protein